MWHVSALVIILFFDALCSGQPLTASITVEDGVFTPSSVQIRTGGNVTFTWAKENMEYKSGLCPTEITDTSNPLYFAPSGQRNVPTVITTEPFNNPGVYHYFCAFSPACAMAGTITVIAPTTTTVTTTTPTSTTITPGPTTLPSATTTTTPLGSGTTTTPFMISTSPPTSTPTATAFPTPVFTPFPSAPLLTCISSPPPVNAICNQGTWILNGPVALDTPLQLISSAPVVVNGDLDQRGNQLSIDVTSTAVPLTVYGTARLNGTLLLTVPPSWNDSVMLIVIQATSIIGTFDHVNLTTTTTTTSTTTNHRWCLTGVQQSDGHSLSVLLKSSCHRHAPVVAIVIPVVCVCVLIGLAISAWYMLRVRRMCPGAADLLWRSKSPEPATAQYHRM